MSLFQNILHKHKSVVPKIKHGEAFTSKTGDKYIVEKLLVKGEFRTIYAVRHKQSNMICAMKVECDDTPNPSFKHEVSVLLALKQASGGHHCITYDRGRLQAYNVKYLVLTLVGHSLDELMLKYGIKDHNGRFSSSTAMQLAIQTLEAIEDLHRAGFVHGDITPRRFAIGRKQMFELRKIYLTDFRHAHEYRDKETNQIKIQTESSWSIGRVGQATRYASLAQHLKLTHSRKDDLESWLYMCIEFNRGPLPWSNLKTVGEVHRAKEACRFHAGTARSQLLVHCPHEYSTIMDYIDNIQFVDKPDYSSMYKNLRAGMNRHVPVITETDSYEWELDYTHKTHDQTTHRTTKQGYSTVT